MMLKDKIIDASRRSEYFFCFVFFTLENEIRFRNTYVYLPAPIYLIEETRKRVTGSGMISSMHGPQSAC